MLHLFIISMILAGGQLHVPHYTIALMILIVSILQLWKTIKEEDAKYKWPFYLEGKWWSEQPHVNVTGAGVVSVKSADILKTKEAKRQIHMLKQLKLAGLIGDKDE